MLTILFVFIFRTFFFARREARLFLSLVHANILVIQSSYFSELSYNMEYVLFLSQK